MPLEKPGETPQPEGHITPEDGIGVPDPPAHQVRQDKMTGRPTGNAQAVICGSGPSQITRSVGLDQIGTLGLPPCASRDPFGLSSHDDPAGSQAYPIGCENSVPR